MRLFLALTLVTWCWIAVSNPSAQSALPARLDAYLTKTIQLTPEERAALVGGEPVAKPLEADPAREVAVFGAIWVDAPVASYIAALEDIENFEKGGGFRTTKKVSEPARIEDFAELVLPPEDIEDLRACEVGSCEIKLGAEGLARLRQQVDWSRSDAKAQVEQIARALAVEYVNAYRAGGNSRLAVYRDSEKPTYVAEEFRRLIAAMPELTEYVPDMRRYLLEFPKTPSRPTKSFIYWQEAEFGLKPTIRINHVAIQEAPTATVVASKQLYSSHYFWTALELRVLVPDPSRGKGFWFVNVNRSRSDGLSGFVGRIIRGKVREGARTGMEAALRATKGVLAPR